MPRKPQTAGNPDDTRRVGNEVLLGTPKALGDDELLNRLHGLQNRLEEVTRARHCVA